MMSRTARFALASLALAAVLAMAPTAVAEDKTHEGKVVKAGDGKLTMTDMDGGNRHSHVVMDEAVITFEGKDVKLAELKEGYIVKVTMRTDEKDKDKTWVTMIEARPKA